LFKFHEDYLESELTIKKATISQCLEICRVGQSASNPNVGDSGIAILTRRQTHGEMKNIQTILFILVISIAGVSCESTAPKDNSITGTWELLSETKIENGDTVFKPASKDQRMLKIINSSHFAFLRHSLDPEKDSTDYVAGGGTYSLAGNVYTEHLQFFIQREWENHDFTFTIEIQNDTLIQQGQEKVEGSGIDRYIIEKYRRVQE
jgi:hypothetical protein